jgi:hypothetical protein
VGLAHEAFLTSWPPLAEVISSTTAALRQRALLEKAAQEWIADDRHPSALLHGPRLAAAQSYLAAETGGGELTSVAQELILSSVAREEDVRRRRRRRGRLLMQLLLAGLLVALVCGYTLIVARIVLFNLLDENLLSHAQLTATSALADPYQLAQTPPEVVLAADVRMALLSADGSATNAGGQAQSPRLGTDELAVARGESPYSIRTARGPTERSTG